MRQFRLEQFLKKAWPYLLVVMAIVIGLQMWGLVRLHRQLNQQEKSLTKDLSIGNFSPGLQNRGGLSLFPNDPFQDDFFKSPFDPNTWDPFQEMQTMQDRINSMFGDAFGRFSQSPQFGNLFNSGSFTPNIDLQDEGDRFVIRIDLPGADASNVDITCEEQELKISGTIDQLQEDRHGGSLLRQERRSGRFSRTIPLPAPVEVDKMETKLDKGVMVVTVPKAKP